MTLKRAAVSGGPEFLNGRFCPVLGYAKTAQRVLHQPERQLALAHDRHPDSLPLQICDLAFAVGPDRRVDPWIDLAGKFDDPARLVSFGCSDQEQPSPGDTRLFQTPGVDASP